MISIYTGWPKTLIRNFNDILDYVDKSIIALTLKRKTT